MRGVSSQTTGGNFRVFTTNNGPHTPEIVAEMSLHQIVDNDSNPLKRAEVRQSLVDLYAQVQRTARVMFKISAGNDALMRSINQILSRDFATALDIERQFHK